MAKKNDSFIVRYSYGTGRNFGRAKNTQSSLKSFRKKFDQPTVTSERFKDFLKMPDKDQGHLKSVAGWFYRTQVDGPVRNRGSGLPADMVTLDFDYATPEFLEALCNGEIMPEWEWFLHTSRRHTDDKPRFRIFVFLEKPVPNDLYNPVSRIVASYFDPDMTAVDKVSFRAAQMMFMPTTSKDGDYVFHENNGELLDWSELLDHYELTKGDWRDITQLPHVPDEELREVAEKAEDPTEKRGVVGDFCRAYSVPEAIEAFGLPYEEVDSHSDKPRYSYTGGTTTNGAVVEDDGLFLYSHHGSDPCSDMLVNAFDLVRIHLYDHKDEKFDPEGKAMHQRPSFKAMLERLEDDERYKAQVVESRYDIDAMNEDFDDAADALGESTEVHESDLSDIPETVGDDEDPEIDELIGKVAEPVAKTERTEKINGVGYDKPFERKLRPEPDKDWIKRLELTDDGKIIANAPNAAQIIQNDKRTRNSIAYNEHLQETVLLRPFITKMGYLPRFQVRDRINGDLWEDIHTMSVRTMIETPAGKGKAGYGFKISDRDMKLGVEVSARHLAFHPIREYLEFCKAKFEASSDSSPQSLVERLWIDYLGTPDTPYYRQTALKFLVACIARAFEPGHKFDFSPIMHGAQGVGKSTFVAILAQHWYGELKADFSNENKLVEQMQGCWLMELPELSSIARAQVEDVKAFISGTGTKVRLAYASRASQYLRQTCFLGSTNDTEYLIDTTGNRRWWPIKVDVESVDLDRLRENIDLIWGAATLVYEEMRRKQPEGYLPLHLSDPDVVAQANELQEQARVSTDVDVYAGRINEFLEKKTYSSDFDAAYQPPKRREKTCVPEVMDYLEIRNPTQQQARIVGKALRANGWDSYHVTKYPNYGRQKIFVPTSDVKQRWYEEDQAEEAKQQAKDGDDLI